MTNSSCSTAVVISKELAEERLRREGVGGAGRALAGGVLIISDDVEGRLLHR